MHLFSVTPQVCWNKIFGTFFSLFFPLFYFGSCYLTISGDLTIGILFWKWLVEYNAALASICFMILLGFVDDVLDVPWRVWVLSPYVKEIFYVTSYLIFWEIYPASLFTFVSFWRQKVAVAICCSSSTVNGLCGSHNYHYTKTSCSVFWREYWSR